MFNLRPYQQECVDKTMAFIRKSNESCVLSLPTASGKSLIIAELAKQIAALSGKKVLCTAPSKELIEQNAEKYKSFGLSCSIYSASLNKKSVFHDVVFGSPQTIVNEVKKSDKFDSKFAAIIVDEAHNLTPSIKLIIETMRKHNKNLRVIGLSATPYRMFSGYIYRSHYLNGDVGREKTINPYFDHCIYALNEWDMIESGFITRPVFGTHNLSYDTSGLKLKSNGQYDQATVDTAFKGKGRLTYEIVNDVISASANRMAVMFFASSVAHADEIMQSLPADRAKLITGETPKKEREQTINQFKRGEFKYLVNVSVLTTGFDAPNVDTIAILRATESPGLFMQIIGRGIRLHENKAECLVLDYAENVGRVVNELDIFEPIMTVKSTRPGEKLEFECPSCRHINTFALDKEYDGAKYNKAGYVINLITGLPEYENIVHLGQRCGGHTHQGQQCDHYWSSSECPECGTKNSKTARVCRSCSAELIDPNEKLNLEFSDAKSVNPYDWHVVDITKSLAHKANARGVIRLDHYDNGVRGSKVLFSEFLAPQHERAWLANKSQLVITTLGIDVECLPQFIAHQNPLSITYRKSKKEGYYEAKNHSYKTS